MPLALRDLHVFHQLTQHLHQFLRLGHPAFFHQALQFIQHLLQLIARHFHPFHVLGQLAVGVTLGLFGKFAHVIVQRLAQFLHQLFDFGRVGTIPHRLVQPVLRAAQSFHRAGQITLFDQQRDFPQLGRDGIARLGREAGLLRVKVAHQDTQAQIGARIADQVFGAMGDGPEHLRGAGGIGAGPQKIAPHLDQGGGQRVEEPLAGQGDAHGIGAALLSRGIRHGEGHRDGQVGEGMLRQVIDQRLGDLCAVARHRHGQIKDHRIARFRVGAKAKAAVHTGQVKRDADPARGHAVIITCGELHRELAVAFAFRTVCRGDRGGHVRRCGDPPCPPAFAAHGHLAAALKREIMQRVRCGGHLGPSRHGFRQGQVAHLAVKAELQARSDGQIKAPFGNVVQVQRRLAGIGGRLRPAFP